MTRATKVRISSSRSLIPTRITTSFLGMTPDTMNTLREHLTRIYPQRSRVDLPIDACLLIMWCIIALRTTTDINIKTDIQNQITAIATADYFKILTGLAPKGGRITTVDSILEVRLTAADLAHIAACARNGTLRTALENFADYCRANNHLIYRLPELAELASEAPSTQLEATIILEPLSVEYKDKRYSTPQLRAEQSTNIQRLKREIASVSAETPDGKVEELEQQLFFEENRFNDHVPFTQEEVDEYVNETENIGDEINDEAQLLPRFTVLNNRVVADGNIDGFTIPERLTYETKTDYLSGNMASLALMLFGFFTNRVDSRVPEIIMCLKYENDVFDIPTETMIINLIFDTSIVVERTRPFEQPSISTRRTEHERVRETISGDNEPVNYAETTVPRPTGQPGTPASQSRIGLERPPIRRGFSPGRGRGNTNRRDISTRALHDRVEYLSQELSRILHSLNEARY